jgi:hypothetical protein
MQVERSDPRGPDDFSLVLGAPLYRFYLRFRLIRPPVGLAHRRIAAVVAIAWLPAAMLSLVAGVAWDGVQLPFFKDVDMHARLLLSVPLLIAAETLVHARLSPTRQQFLERGLIAPEHLHLFDDAVASAVRMRDSATFEALLVVFVLTVGHWMWLQQAMHVTTWYSVDGRLTLPGYWLAFVGLPIWRFLLYRWYFRLFVWYRVMWSIARIPLRLNALHPDLAGGLGFLGKMPAAFTPVLLAHTVALSAGIADRILIGGAQLFDFKILVGVAIVLLLVLVLVPLTFFVPQLEAARRTAAREYGAAASTYVNLFRAKWLQAPDPSGESILGTSDIQSLADLNNSYGTIAAMRSVPLTQSVVITLAVVLLFPLVPLLLTVMPLAGILSSLMKVAL